METYQPKTTPIDPKHVLNHRPNKDTPDIDAKARFGAAIGSLMYLMVGTRPDIAFALGTLSLFTSRPQSHHQAALQRLLRYIKATQSHRINVTGKRAAHVSQLRSWNTIVNAINYNLIYHQPQASSV
jgi:hypothetical protein